MVQHDHRNFLDGEQLRGQATGMTGNDGAVTSDQDGVGPAELVDRGGHLSDLSRTMGSRVTGIREQSFARPDLDFIGRHSAPPVPAVSTPAEAQVRV